MIDQEIIKFLQRFQINISEVLYVRVRFTTFLQNLILTTLHWAILVSTSCHSVVVDLQHALLERSTTHEETFACKFCATFKLLNPPLIHKVPL